MTLCKGWKVFDLLIGGNGDEQRSEVLRFFSNRKSTISHSDFLSLLLLLLHVILIGFYEDLIQRVWLNSLV
ncbi:hypothetical protein CMV_023375 [Castanea mollissima]|uniref:Uncharacterized protein n=1 Tax=Castanea mollissima TaxID=60419 RepID=A0A8J4QQ13_9ROSI|nr:hypothetical protein CMV_023375 [Castanea mollissima]